MHIAVIDKDKCHFKKCQQECQYYCPPVRNGTMVVEFGEDGYPIIHEDICIGCGICAHRCPYEAIKIIGIPERQEGNEVHRYGENGFVLYGMPTLEVKGVIGILGQNGTGKSTILNVLTGNLIPNLGKDKGSTDAVLERFKGTYLGNYLRDLYSSRIKISLKPQYVDLIPKYFNGKVKELLRDNPNSLNYLDQFGFSNILEKNLKDLSGGELQGVAISAALGKEAEYYFLDEPSSYLDIKQRLLISRMIRKLSETKRVIVVEHDLAILDYMTDFIYLTYGEPRAYGIVSNSYSTRQAVNSYIEGYIRQENIKFRDFEIKFVKKPPELDTSMVTIFQWGNLIKRFNGFTLMVNPGTLKKGQVIGVIGPNGTGKSTFLKLLSGELKPDDGYIENPPKIAYKPQQPNGDEEISVYEFIERSIGDRMNTNEFKNEILKPLNLDSISETNISELSGGDLQKVYIAKTMGQDAELYFLDEPSAYLDADQRMIVARIIKRFTENSKKSAMIVDHDIYFIDLISTSLIVFDGESGVRGETFGPTDMKDGMNRFLSNIGVTFRRDENTLRPRINKENSKNDMEQKKKGEYYYY